MGTCQSFPSMILINMCSGSTILTKASYMTWKNTSTGIGMLRAVTFAKSSASVFCFFQCIPQ
jgi:hypothetical protein